MIDTFWFSTHFILRAVFVFLLYFVLFTIMRTVWKEMTMRVRTQSEVVKSGDPGRLRIVNIDPTLQTSARIDDSQPLKPHTTIGRADDNTIVLDDETASRHHAIFHWDGVDWFFKDTSTHGSFVNGRKLHGTEMKLSPHDRITMGGLTFELLTEEMSHAPFA